MSRFYGSVCRYDKQDKRGVQHNRTCESDIANVSLLYNTDKFDHSRRIYFQADKINF